MSSSFDFSKSKIPAKLQQSKTSKSTGVKELEYDDKRGESVAQLKLQDAADKSHSVNNLVDIEEQANSSNQVAQLVEIQNIPSLNDGIIQFGEGDQNNKENGSSKGTSSKIASKAHSATKVVAGANETADNFSGADGTRGASWAAQKTGEEDDEGNDILNTDNETFQIVGEVSEGITSFTKTFSGLVALSELLQKENRSKGFWTIENMERVEKVIEGAEGGTKIGGLIHDKVKDGEASNNQAASSAGVSDTGFADAVNYIGGFKDGLGAFINLTKSFKKVKELMDKKATATSEEKIILSAELSQLMVQFASDTANCYAKFETILSNADNAAKFASTAAPQLSAALQVAKNCIELLRIKMARNENYKEIDDLIKIKTKEQMKWVESQPKEGSPHPATLNIDSIVERERIKQAHETNLKNNKGKKTYTKGHDEVLKQEKESNLELTKEQLKILDKYAALDEIIKSNEKQIHRSYIKISADLLKLGGNIAKIVPSLEALTAGSALVAGGAALEMGAAAARNVKQATRDAATHDGVGGKLARGITGGEADSSKSTAAKRDYRKKQSQTLYDLTSDLYKNEGSPEIWKEKNKKYRSEQMPKVINEVMTHQRKIGKILTTREKADKQQEIYKKKYSNGELPTDSQISAYKDHSTMLKGVDINENKLNELYSKPDEFIKEIYKGICKRDII